MEYRDYYKILGVDKTASQDEIKRAYKKHVRKYHPDINSDAEADQKFKDANEANEVLGDPEKRAAYDQAGKSYQAGQDFRPPPGWDQGHDFSNSGPQNQQQARDYSAFFEDLFGRQQQQQQRGHPREQAHHTARGQDHHAKIEIDLEDVFSGAKRAITLKVPELADDGYMHLRQRNIEISIPKGVREGQHIRLKGLGTPGSGGGANGDLYIEVAYAPHAWYRTEGADLYLDLPVTPWEAALGGKVKAPTPQGNVDVSIPANSASGRKLRLKGRGLPGVPKGDLYLILKIALPEADTDKARKLYTDMARDLEFDPRAKMNKALR